MSLPERSSVWSPSRLPGTAGSGICLTQTAMFIRCSGDPGAPINRSRLTDDLILAAIAPPVRNVGGIVGTVDPLTTKLQDLLVVGAGPAGIAAGIEARRLGLDALVVDKATFPRDKTCGD